MPDREDAIGRVRAMVDQLEGLKGRIDRALEAAGWTLDQVAQGQPASETLRAARERYGEDVLLGFVHACDDVTSHIRRTLIRSLIAEDLTYREIGELMGVSRQRAWKYARDTFGVEQLEAWRAPRATT